MRAVRRLAAAVSIAVLAAACSPEDLSETLDEVISVPAEETPSPEADAAPDDEGTSGADGTVDESDTEDVQPDEPASEPQDGASSEAVAEEPAPEPQLTPLQDGAAVGSNGAAYLRGDRSRVVIEVDVQAGAALPQGVLDHVRSILDRESNAAVELVTGTADVERRDAWTADQLRAAAGSTRDVAHGDDVAVLHLLVLRDGFEDDGVLGLAFDSSAAVVFPDQWSSLTGLLLSGDRIARAVTTHEVGHLLGLVGLAQEPVSNHEDPEHPGHTTDQDDVMYWAVETDLIGSLDGVPDDFGPQTRADLAALRDG